MIGELIFIISAVFVLCFAALVASKFKSCHSNRVVAAAIATPIQPKQAMWEPTATSHDTKVCVYVKRGKTSILIGETDILLEDVEDKLATLTAQAEMRATALNSMGIKWDGDLGTTVSSEIYTRSVEDRESLKKEVKELKSLVDTMMSPDSFNTVIQQYIRSVCPKIPLGTIRIVNDGQVLVEMPPGRPALVRAQGPQLPGRWPLA